MHIRLRWPNPLARILNRRSRSRSRGRRDGRRPSRLLVVFLALLTAIGLSAIATFFDLALAILGLSLILIFAIWQLSRGARKEQASFQARLDEQASHYQSVIDVLCSALDLRDSVTIGHSKKVSQLASVLAWQMGLRKEDVRLVEKAVILHDIGKMGLDQDVLSNSGALTDLEWAEMKRHPELGHRILSEIHILKDAAEIVLSHHERFDGQGYPHGLAGEEIPLGARIFAVVDAYAAMTTNKPYRKLMRHEMAVKEIVRNSLTQFDPEVVRAFLEAEKRGLLQLKEDDDAGEEVRLPVPSEV